MVGFHEETTFVGEDIGLDDQNVGDGGGGNPQCVFSKKIKYSLNRNSKPISRRFCRTVEHASQLAARFFNLSNE